MHRLLMESERDEVYGMCHRASCRCGAKSSWHEAEEDAQEWHDQHMQDVTVSALRASDPGVQFVPIRGDEEDLAALREWLSRFGLEA